MQGNNQNLCMYTQMKMHVKKSCKTIREVPYIKLLLLDRVPSRQHCLSNYSSMHTIIVGHGYLETVAWAETTSMEPLSPLGVALSMAIVIFLPPPKSMGITGIWRMGIPRFLSTLAIREPRVALRALARPDSKGENSQLIQLGMPQSNEKLKVGILSMATLSSPPSTRGRRVQPNLAVALGPNETL